MSLYFRRLKKKPGWRKVGKTEAVLIREIMERAARFYY